MEGDEKDEAEPLPVYLDFRSLCFTDVHTALYKE